MSLLKEITCQGAITGNNLLVGGNYRGAISESKLKYEFEVKVSRRFTPIAIESP
ncbi:MAG: hypothetical protein ACI9FN_003385 [Saprospiraceae bacterium]|jgi:hypothetical protein